MSSQGMSAGSMATRLMQKGCARSAVLALALGAMLVQAPPLAASAAGAQHPSCAQLKGKHLKSGGRAVVVTRLLNKERTENSLERVAYVCASPNGRSWPAGSAISHITPEVQPTIEVVAGAGYWVALSFLDVYAEGPGGGNVTAIDAATGRQVQLGVFAPLRTVINARGQAAFLARIEAPIENLGEAPRFVGEKLVAVEPSGKRKVLESGPSVKVPPASLKLVGSTVHWQDGGVEHTATL